MTGVQTCALPILRVKTAPTLPLLTAGNGTEFIDKFVILTEDARFTITFPVPGEIDKLPSVLPTEDTPVDKVPHDMVPEVFCKNFVPVTSPGSGNAEEFIAIEETEMFDANEIVGVPVDGETIIFVLPEIDETPADTVLHDITPFELSKY